MKNRITILMLLVSVLTTSKYAQEVEWIKFNDSTNSHLMRTGKVCANTNHVYYSYTKAGAFKLIKRAIDGSLVDSIQVSYANPNGGTDAASIEDMDVDEFGNLFLLIHTNSILSLGGSVIHPFNSSTRKVMLQFDPNFNFVREYITPNSNYACFAIDNQNNLFKADNISNDTLYIKKYNSTTGIVVDSIQQINTFFSDIQLDNNDNLYSVGGVTSNTPIFESVLGNSSGNNGVYNIKYDSNKQINLLNIDNAALCMPYLDKLLTLDDGSFYHYQANGYRLDNWNNNIVTIEKGTYSFNSNLQYLKVIIFDSNRGLLHEKKILHGEGYLGSKGFYVEDNKLYVTGSFNGDLTVNNFVYNSGVQNKVFLLKLDLSESISSVYKEKVSDNDIVVYPNPSSSSFYISSEEEIINYQVYTVGGRLVLNEEISPSKKIVIRDNVIDKGVYFVLMNSKRGALHKKIIKN